jgi:hypothetical protein
MMCTRKAALPGARIALLVAGIPLVAACDQFLPGRRDLTLPAIEEVRRIYAEQGQEASEIRYSGNVVEIRAVQSADQLQRGGELWARVGPYIHLFTPATRDVMQTYPGVAAVRAITRTANGREIARAMLVNDSLGTAQWARAINLLGRAVTEGTERPMRMQELVRFGELHTEYRYSRDFVNSRPRQ